MREEINKPIVVKVWILFISLIFKEYRFYLDTLQPAQMASKGTDPVGSSFKNKRDDTLASAPVKTLSSNNNVGMV